MRRSLVAVVAVLLAVTACSSSGGSKPSTSPPASTPPTTSTPTTETAAPTSSSPSTSGSSAPVHQTLTDFRALDLTVVGDQLWALGSADCLDGGGTCDAIEHSTDGGATWQSEPAPKAGIVGARPCAGTCVAHLRFATDKIGYAYSSPGDGVDGAGSFFMTTDGGTTWQQQDGHPVALESLDGNVIRVVTTSDGCPPGCHYVVQTAAVGSTTWQTVTLPGRQAQGDGAELARSGSHAYLLDTGNPAGGADDATSVLWSSADDGLHWTNRGEPCPQSGGHEVDSSELSAAPDGAVGVLCTERGGQGARFVAVSTDGGAHFAAKSRTALGAADVTAFALGSASVVLVSSDDTYRSTDGGGRFARLAANAGSSPGQLSYVGFASATVVHGIVDGGQKIATSTDGGRTWQTHSFG